MVAEIGDLALNLFSSLFTDKIVKCLQDWEIKENFNKIDSAIIDEIANSVLDEYPKEKLINQIIKEDSYWSGKCDFISETERTAFIDDFYKKNQDLQYVERDRINECLNRYIDRINEELNKRISQEGKAIITTINKSEENIINSQNSNTYTIIKKIDGLRNNSQEQVTYRNYNIPAASKLFYGREVQLCKLIKIFENPNLVIINGLGGIGKTQIAKKFICQQKKEYNIVVWISAENMEELNHSYRQAALFYNLIENSKEYEQENINNLVKNYLDNIEKSMLIIDGVEDIELNDLLDYIPSNARVIVTTQNSNIDPDEFHVIPVDDFTEDEAINFLLSNTNNRICTENDRAEAKELISLLKHYPLALEYSRAYINKHRVSIKNYKELYQEHSLSLLNSKLPSYKKTIYTAWKISFDKAVDRNRITYDVMAMCSYFALLRIPFRDIFLKSDYTITELMELEENLLNYSLITIDGAYIGMHGITQEFTRNMLQDNGENIKILERDIKILKSSFPFKINSFEDKQRVLDFLPHARKVCDFCIDKSINGTDEFCGEIGTKLYAFGMYVECIDYIKKAIKLSWENKAYFRYADYTTFLIQSNHYIGNSKVALEISGDIIDFINNNEGLLNDLKREYLYASIEGAKGIIQKDLGEIQTALNNFKSAFTRYQHLAYIDGQINQLINIGITYKYMAKYGLALESYQKALDLCKQDKRSKAKILGNMGFLYKLQGDIPRAYNTFKEALAISNEVGDLRSECITYHHIGECCLELNDIECSETNLEKSLAIAKEINFAIGIVNVYNSYGRLNFEKKKDPIKSKEYFQEAYSLSNQIEYASGKEYARDFLKYFGIIL